MAVLSARDQAAGCHEGAADDFNLLDSVDELSLVHHLQHPGLPGDSGAVVHLVKLRDDFVQNVQRLLVVQLREEGDIVGEAGEHHRHVLVGLAKQLAGFSVTKS